MLGILLFAPACTKRETPAQEGIRTGTLLVGNSADPQSLDPHILALYTDMRVAMSLFEGLTVFDEATAKPIPGSATHWEISADGLQYTFHLRPEAKWSDGERLTAADFVYSFQRILSPALASPYANMLWPLFNAEAYNTGKIKDASAIGAKAIDDLTLHLTLERPTPFLPSLAAHNTWYPVPKRIIEKYGPGDSRNNPWARPLSMVGNGAFTLTEWRSSARIVVTKNPRYWNAAQNRLDRVIFFPTERTDTEELNFRAGQVHVTYGLPALKLDHYRKQSPELLRNDPQLGLFWFILNVTRPPLNNPKVRQALAMTIDRQAISDRIFAGARLPADTFIPPGCGGYTPTSKRLSHDPARARELLAEAGFAGGKGVPSLPLMVGNDEKSPKMAEIVQEAWKKELGIQSTVEMTEQKVAMSNQQSGEFVIALNGWLADYPDPFTFFETLLTGNGNNCGRWSNPKYDALILESNRTLDPTRRFALMQEAESIVMEETPVALLVNGTRTYLKHPAVKNWVSSPLGLNRYQLIELKP